MSRLAFSTRRFRTRRFAMAFLSIAFFATFGCGAPAAVVVKGKLVKNGQPYTSAENDQVMVGFREDSSAELPQAFHTRANADGTFKITGPEGRGIPLGKYKVIVSNRPLIPGPGVPPGDKLNSAFDENRTPLRAEVGATSEFTFDLKTP